MKTIKQLEKIKYNEKGYAEARINLKYAKKICEMIGKIKIIKDEICQCGCSKKAHMPHQLDKHGGKCMICVHCPIYTWKGFEFVDLKELLSKIKGLKNENTNKSI